MEDSVMQEFKTKLLEKLRELTLGTNYDVRCDTFVKPNDTSYETINLVNEGVCFSANFYLAELFDGFQKGRSIDEIAEMMIFVENKNAESKGDVDNALELLDRMKDYNFIRSRLTIRLYSLRSNQQYLKEKFYLPYLPSGDGEFEFAICFYGVLENTKEGIRTIAVPDKIREEWEVTDEEILKDALCYQEKHFPAVMMNLQSVLEKGMEVFLQGKTEFSEYMNPPQGNALYVITNRQEMNGATVILYDHFLEETAKRLGEDFYLLPSSVHELIVAPCSFVEGEPEKLLEMVRAVNRNCVQKTEILSDRLFCYRQSTKTLSVWKEEAL
jgi:hypothetical protein